MNRRSKGFTLVELLVVISIISLLSSVVLATLTSARLKSREALIRGSFNSIQKQAELLGFDDATYIDLCNDQKIIQIINSIKKDQIKVGCAAWNDSSFGNSWGVSAIITSNPTMMYSVSKSSSIVSWDQSGSPDTKKDYNSARNYCISKGGDLPSGTALASLYLANGSNPGFENGYYWGKEAASDNTAYRYLVDMSNGGKAAVQFWASDYARCVK